MEKNEILQEWIDEFCPADQEEALFADEMGPLFFDNYCENNNEFSIQMIEWYGLNAVSEVDPELDQEILFTKMKHPSN